MSEYKVSVLVPVFGVSAYIEKCAHSLFAQTFRDIEYVFVDDCTPDDSILKLKNVLAFYPERLDSVEIIRHAKNSGISAARQTAFDAATGDYFLAMDSDDFIEPDMIELLYNKAVEDNADMVFCSYFSEYGDNKSELSKNDFVNDKLGLINMAIQGHSAYWNKLINRNLLTENNIRTLDGIDHGDDLSVIIKLLYYAQTFSYVPKHLYHYNQGNLQSTTKKFKPKYIEDRLKLVADIDQFYSSKPDYKYFEPSILLLKALRKTILLRLSNGERFLDLYPEINPEIYQLSIPFKLKLLLWLAALNQKFLVKKLLSLFQIISLIN